MGTEKLTAAGGITMGIWLVILFSGVLFWAFRPKNKKRFESDGLIPFRDDAGGDA